MQSRARRARRSALAAASPIVVATSGLLASLGLAAGQEAPVTAVDEAVEVAVITVDVVVTDADGEPVHGLTPSDFTVYEDGEEVPITNFEGSGGDGAGGDGAAPRRWLAVYVDGENVPPGGRSRVLADLEEVLAGELPPALSVAVLGHEGTGAAGGSAFTRDSAEISRALRAGGETAPGATETRIQRRLAMERIEGIYRQWEDALENPSGAFVCPSADPCECGSFEMDAVAKEYAGLVDGRRATTFARLTELVLAMGALPDSKSVFYFGSGVSDQAGLEVFQYLEQVCPHLGDLFRQSYMLYDASGQLRQLAELASNRRVTFYAFDAAGLAVDSGATIEHSDSRFAPSSLVQRTASTNSRGLHGVLAEVTGGRAVSNANGYVEAMEEIEAESLSYYSIGFRPARVDDESHRIEVEVKGRGLEVRHRLSHRSRPLEERLVDGLTAALVFGVEQRELPAEVEVRAKEGAPGGLAPVEVEIAVPAGALERFPADQAQALLRVLLTVKQRGGETTPVRQRLFQVALGEGGAGDEPYRLGVTVGLAPGDYEIAIGVRDEIGARTAFLRLELTIPR